jgi:hypothetical protein
MKLHALIILALAMSVASCARKEESAPEPAADVPEPVVEAPAADASADPQIEFGDQAFLKHMHAHADQIDDVNFALADGDLEAVMTPAYWLGRHESVDGVPEEWQPFVTGMRDGAKALEAATDLESARVAAANVTAQCQGCHAAAGIIENQATPSTPE